MGDETLRYLARFLANHEPQRFTLDDWSRACYAMAARKREQFEALWPDSGAFVAEAEQARSRRISNERFSRASFALEHPADAKPVHTPMSDEEFDRLEAKLDGMLAAVSTGKRVSEWSFGQKPEAPKPEVSGEPPESEERNG